MRISLDNRTEATVRSFFERAQQPFIKVTLPLKAQSVEEAISDYLETLLPSATSFGRIVRVEGRYVGDIWCYCMDKAGVPNAMLSVCLLDRTYWGRGIASEAVRLFLREVRDAFGLETMGAFTFCENLAAQRVLEKNGFLLFEEFVEDGRASRYYQLSI